MAKTQARPKQIRVYVLYQSHGNWYLGQIARDKNMLRLHLWDYACQAERVAFTSDKGLAQACKEGPLGPRKFKAWAERTNTKVIRGVVVDELEIPRGAVQLVGCRSGGFPFNYWRAANGATLHTGLTARQKRHMNKQTQARDAVPGAGHGRGNVPFPKDIPLRQPKALRVQ